jgi:hypothetical protein
MKNLLNSLVNHMIHVHGTRCVALHTLPVCAQVLFKFFGGIFFNYSADR